MELGSANIGKRLAAFILKERTKRGLSQEKLAWASGLSKVAIQNIEKGRRLDPQISTVAKIAEGFKMKFSELAKAIE